MIISPIVFNTSRIMALSQLCDDCFNYLQCIIVLRAFMEPNYSYYDFHSITLVLVTSPKFLSIC